MRVNSNNRNFLFALLVLCLVALTARAAGGGNDKCLESQQFKCPNSEDCPSSGYSYVSDCLDCNDNLNTDNSSEECFTRKIFSAKENPSPHYLWRDILGMLVWFCAAGVATACGVGGGGIYVPLGIILLDFAPKPASGLSQSSIFGASLGGLVLNLRNKHPFTAKIEQTGEVESGDGAPAKERVVTDVPTSDCEIEDGVIKPNTDTVKYYTRPLIDYDMALFLAPMEMAGAVLGVLIQQIFPNWLYLFAATVILGFTAKKTYHKWWDTRAKELAKQAADLDGANSEEQVALADNIEATNNDAEAVDANGDANTDANTDANADDAAAKEQEEPTGGDDAETKESPEGPSSDGAEQIDAAASVPAAVEPTPAPAAPKPFVPEVADTDFDYDDVAAADANADGNATTSSMPGVVGVDADAAETMDDENTNVPIAIDVVMDDEKMAKRIYFLERDTRQYPTEKLICFGVLWVGLTLLTFLKGGKGVDSLIGIDCSSPWYGVLMAIQFLWTFGFAAFFAVKLMKETSQKKAVGYPFHAQDVLWDFQKTRFYAFFTFVAGIVAGLIGIGGGMVLGPLMLVMGIYPRVSTATTATMIVLTSSSVAILYITSGLVPLQYAITFFCTCLTGALVGKTFIDGYVKRTGKSSVLIFLLATIIALATIGALGIALQRLNEADWCFAGFNQFCSINADKADVVCAPSDAERALGSDFYGHVVRGAGL